MAAGKVDKMKGHLDVTQLEKMRKADLQNMAEKMGISTEGTVKELAARIAAEEVEIPEESELTEKEKATVAAAEKKAEAQDTAGNKNKTPDVSEADTKKEVKVRVTQVYKDNLAGQIFRPGFEFVASEKRAAELVKADVVEIIG